MEVVVVGRRSISKDRLLRSGGKEMCKGGSGRGEQERKEMKRTRGGLGRRCRGGRAPAQSEGVGIRQTSGRGGRGGREEGVDVDVDVASRVQGVRPGESKLRWVEWQFI